MPTEGMIFAAGFGTRMGDLTRDTPKPLVPFAGQRLVDRTLRHAAEAGVTRLVANAHYLADQVANYLEPKGCVVVRETPDILDTGGGLKAAAAHFSGGTVFTANPDAVWSGPNPFAVLSAAWEEGTAALLLCVDVDNAMGRETGDFHLDGDGRVTRPGRLVYGGIQIIRLSAVTAEPGRIFSLNAVWNRLARDGTLRVCEYPGTWCDVGTPEGLRRAERMVGRDA